MTQPIPRRLAQTPTGIPIHITSEDLLPDVELPTEKSTPETDSAAFTYYLYGYQKIGKTSFTSMFPNACHIFYEPSGEDYSLYDYTPKTWDHFRGFVVKCEKAKAEGTLVYKNFTIDVVDLCYMQCLKAVCARQGLEYPPEKDFGKTWNKIAEEFRHWVHRLSQIGGCIFVSHAKEKDIESADGTKYTNVVPTASGACHNILSKFCTVTCYYHIGSDRKRYLGVAPNVLYEAGNRFRNHFKYKDSGKKMDLIPMGDSEQEAYKNFSLAFNNGFSDPAEIVVTQESENVPVVTQPVKPATGFQIRRAVK